eukprot:scaffold120047_cov19-Tisochrysis_lutea.AAC.1
MATEILTLLHDNMWLLRELTSLTLHRAITRITTNGLVLSGVSSNSDSATTTISRWSAHAKPQQIQEAYRVQRNSFNKMTFNHEKNSNMYWKLFQTVATMYTILLFTIENQRMVGGTGH